MAVGEEDVTFADACHNQILSTHVDDDLAADKGINNGNKENKGSKRRLKPSEDTGEKMSQ